MFFKVRRESIGNLPERICGFEIYDDECRKKTVVEDGFYYAADAQARADELNGVNET